MALSNIFREPRREITESVVGLAIFGVVAAADYAFAQWLETFAGFRQYTDGTRFYYMPWPLGMCVGLLVAVVVFGILFLTHVMGDAICNALQQSGIHLRPKQRR